jgi:AAA15 family ATPase/GTPase
VFEWFQKNLIVVTESASFNASLTFKLVEAEAGKNELLSFMKQADLGITDIAIKREPVPDNIVFSKNTKGVIFERTPTSGSTRIHVAVSHFSDDEHHASLDLFEESAGMQTFFRTAGAWLNVLKQGEVLLVDEIEASLHPLLVKFLIQKFHSEKSNVKNSQLIFTTQNSGLLDQALFRRDQFWFAEKNREGGSTLYPLTDFTMPRKDEDLERGYLRGRYGALPMIDDV